MEFQGQERLDAPRSRVWAILMDPQRYFPCVPGVQNVRPTGDGQFAFELKIAGQTIKADGRWLRREEPGLAEMQIKAGNFAGKGIVTNTVELHEESSDTTQVSWKADVELNGLLSRIAGNRIPALLGKLNQQVLDCVQRQLQET